MRFGARLESIDIILRKLLYEAIGMGFIKQKDVSEITDIDVRKLKKYYSNSPAEERVELSLDKVIRLIEFVLGCDVTDLEDEDEQLYALFRSFEALCNSGSGESVFEVGNMELSPDVTGDPGDFEKLEGVYYVMRRIYASDKIMVSAIEIEYDAENNMCIWSNIHRGSSSNTRISGVVTESHGTFSFVGYITATSKLHAMSLPRPLAWKEISGIVLTHTGKTDIASRAVLLRTDESVEQVVDRCGEMTIEDVVELGLSTEEYLNNECAHDGVLHPLTDF